MTFEIGAIKVRLSPSSVVAFGGTVVLIAFALDLFGPVERFVPVFVAVVSTIFVAIGILRFRPSPNWNWWMIFGALWLFIAGGTLSSLLGTLGNLTPSRSLVPDLIIIPGYIILAAGLMRLSGGKRYDRGKTVDAILDGLMAGLSVLAVAWVFLIEPLGASRGISISIRLALVAYPPMSSILLILVLRIAFTSDVRRSVAYWLLLGAFSMMFLGDSLYMFVDADLLHLPLSILGLPYGGAYVLASCCALSPSMRRLSISDSHRGKGYQRIQFSLITLSLATPAFLIFGQQSVSFSDRVVVFVVDIGLVGAATTRVLRAMSVARRSEDQLAHVAAYDALTGLPNRRLLSEELARILEDSASKSSFVALIFVDLDQFKLINDSFGHTFGDLLLIGVAQRLRLRVRQSDLVARLGGDEFLIVLKDVPDAAVATAVAADLRDFLREPFLVNGLKFFVTGSFGIALTSPNDSLDTEALLRSADTAMFQAKMAGRDTFRVFDSSMQTEVTRRLELKYDLRRAIELDQLFLVYQPIIATRTGRVEGVEALIRWNHPRHGLISPTDFIPIAEESGMILEIGAWVLDIALDRFTSLNREMSLDDDFYVSVNLSVGQLIDSNLAIRVHDALVRHKVEGRSLCIELTESMVMENLDNSFAILLALKELGVRLAIDDFGSGYSSLAYLTKFPVDKLKIDKSFIDSMVSLDSPDARLIGSIVAMAKSLGMSTIAEGVETLIQAQRIFQLGCDSIQGFYLSRPVEAADLHLTIGDLERASNLFFAFDV